MQNDIFHNILLYYKYGELKHAQVVHNCIIYRFKKKKNKEKIIVHRRDCTSKLLPLLIVWRQFQPDSFVFLSVDAKFDHVHVVLQWFTCLADTANSDLFRYRPLYPTFSSGCYMRQKVHLVNYFTFSLTLTYYFGGICTILFVLYVWLSSSVCHISMVNMIQFPTFSALQIHILSFLKYKNHTIHLCNSEILHTCRFQYDIITIP